MVNVPLYMGRLFLPLWHLNMIYDKHRNELYRKALRKVVARTAHKFGDAVALDLGRPEIVH